MVNFFHVMTKFTYRRISVFFFIVAPPKNSAKGSLWPSVCLSVRLSRLMLLRAPDAFHGTLVEQMNAPPPPKKKTQSQQIREILTLTMRRYFVRSLQYTLSLCQGWHNQRHVIQSKVKVHSPLMHARSPRNYIPSTVFMCHLLSA